MSSRDKHGHPVSPCACGRLKLASAMRCEQCHNQNRGVLLTSSSSADAATVASDRERQRMNAELTSLRRRYEDALASLGQKEKELETMCALSEGLDTFEIKPVLGSGKSEATPVLVASDWHIEEKVGAEVGGLNRYSLDIAKVRATAFFRAGLRLVKLLHQDVNISTVVLALLGDFITNDIHDGAEAEKNAEMPMNALVTAQSFLISGIEFFLKNSEYKLVIPCHSGNHARTTKTNRWGAENGHSLEYLMFLYLSAYFREEPRVTFVIPEGMHSYMQIYDQTVRFHHGHAIKYGGGVGGIFIPAYKAIAQWNKGRHADLDVFGHFHQTKDGGNFLCNGSLIGYNAFALAIKADYEPPRQTLFLIDKKRGRTCTWPILVEAK